LVRVHAASVNALDYRLLRGRPFLARLGGRGLRKPTDPRLGMDLAGRLEAVGGKVTRMQVGDAVFGRGWGTFADYVCAREDAVALKPSRVSFEAAAAVPVAALTALEGLREKGRIQPGQRVLIQGASGGVGTFAVQLAKALGAHVTAVCGTRHVEIVRSLGADRVIDYTQTDFTGDQREQRQRYDLIVGVNGYHPVFAYLRALRPAGRYVMVGASNAHLFQAMRQVMLLGPVISRVGSKKVGLLVVARPTLKELELVQGLLEAGKVVPVIDRQYPLRETAEAIRYLEQGHARGKVVITVDQESHAD
jgi:NADPH:quinone reductase-like Zn-dependent oxidoreductase